MNKDPELAFYEIMMIASAIIVLGIIFGLWSMHKRDADHAQYLIDYKCKFVSQKELPKAVSCGKNCARLAIEKTYQCAYGAQIYEE